MVKGQGMPIRGTEKYGNLLATVSVQFPDSFRRDQLESECIPSLAPSCAVGYAHPPVACASQTVWLLCLFVYISLCVFAVVDRLFPE